MTRLASILIEIDFQLQKGMTVKNISKPGEGHDSEVGVWYCENCLSFHMKAEGVLITFTKDEFGAFSSAVFDTYSSALTLDEMRGNMPYMTSWSEKHSITH